MRYVSYQAYMRYEGRYDLIKFKMVIEKLTEKLIVKGYYGINISCSDLYQGHSHFQFLIMVMVMIRSKGQVHGVGLKVSRNAFLVFKFRSGNETDSLSQ